MNTDDFGEIAFTPRRYDDTARYLGLSPDSVRRWSTTAVMYSRIGMRIGSLIHAIAMESGASEAFIRENATQGRLHYLHTKRIPKEHIVELLTMTIIQEQMDFDGDSIRHAPCTFNITFSTPLGFRTFFGPRPVRARRTVPARHTGYQEQPPHGVGRSLRQPLEAGREQGS